MRGLPGAAGGDVADADRRNFRLVNPPDAVVEEEMPQFQREIIGCEEPVGGEQAEERCKERATAEGEQADGHEEPEEWHKVEYLHEEQTAYAE